MEHQGGQSSAERALRKSKLDPEKIVYIKKVTFRMYSLSFKEPKAVEWGTRSMQ